MRHGTLQPLSTEHTVCAIREVAQSCGALKAILFGSFARGTATAHSDIDVVFVEVTPARFLDRLDKYMKALFDRLAVSVDVFVYTPEEFARMQGGPFMDRVMAEGRVVYER